MRFIFTILLILGALSIAGCGCGDDDDDDDSSSPPVDDDDNDDDDDTTDDDDDDNDDTTDDDDDIVDEPINCIPPLDYDGDEDVELLQESYDSGDGTLRLYLVEPGTWQREEIFSYSSKQGPVNFYIADFDGNGVWDFATHTYVFGPPSQVTYDFYMNGNFAHPAKTFGPFADTTPWMFLVDTDLDQLPEVIMITAGSSKGPLTFDIVDPSDDFAVTGTVGDGAATEFQPLPIANPGEIYKSAGHFTSQSSGPELAWLEKWEDSGSAYFKLHILDAVTGESIDSSDDIDIGDEDIYSDAKAGDLDGDGLMEIMVNNAHYDSSGSPSITAEISIFGAGFIEEYNSGTFPNEYPGGEVSYDFDMDGLIDPMIGIEPSGWEYHFTALSGADAYNDLFTYDRPADTLGGWANRFGRNNLDIGYDFDGNGADRVMVMENHSNPSVTVCEISILDIATSMQGSVLASIPLGEGGDARKAVADFDGDGNMELAVLTKWQEWNGVSWDYEIALHIYSGADMELLFSEILGTESNFQLVENWDLDGDHNPELVIYEEGANRVMHIYDCEDGDCDHKLNVSFGANESFWFMGPVL